jgi:hypothetical protein
MDEKELNETVGRIVGQKIGESCGGTFLEIGEAGGFECNACGAWSLSMPEAHTVKPYDYAGSIEHAWKVVKYLENILDFEWSLVVSAGGYTFRMHNRVHYDGLVGKGETEMLAICRAALQADA